MHAWDIIAYHVHGDAVCPPCAKGHDEKDPEWSPVFAEHLSGEIGASCSTCRKCLTADGWEELEDVMDPQHYLWSVCAECNSQLPHPRAEAADEVAEMRRYGCRNCRSKNVSLQAHQWAKKQRRKTDGR